MLINKVKWDNFGKEDEIYEGELSKYTNVLGGWKPRWFVLDARTGQLHYYLNEFMKKNLPRGIIHLGTAVISLNYEDGITFSLNTTMKLRAQDAVTRKRWVDRLLAVSLIHFTPTLKISPSLSSVTKQTVIDEPAMVYNDAASRLSDTLLFMETMHSAKDHLYKAEQNQFVLEKAIEKLPSMGKLKYIDPDLLVLKASSQSMLVSLNQCFTILQQESSCKFIPEISTATEQSIKKFP